MSEPPSSSALARWVPQVTVFVSSFCIMVIELVAGRIISRHLGSSLYTWTSVIGIVLAGIAAGNYIGGRLADRFPARPTLAAQFVLSSILCVTITMLNHRVGDWVFLWGLPWPLRVGSHVAIVFLAPSLMLGTISPVAAKLAIDNSRETGRTIGSVYAWGVVGSIVGTFATGFWFIALFGTATVVWAVAGILAFMAILFGVSSWKTWGWSALLAGLAVLGLGPWGWAETLGARLSLREVFGPDVIYVDESQYSHIRIHRVSTDPERRDMMLDKLLHSTMLMDRPDELQYGYARIYDAVTNTVSSPPDSLNTLLIGGGGYVYPRHLQHTRPGSRTEVVEIDPAVTKAALEAFGLPADHHLLIRHEDGRAFLRQKLEETRGSLASHYDLVYVDAVSDYAVPYQLTTTEFFRQVDEVLAPDGAVLMNMIDVFAEGRFLASLVKTMSEVFPHVDVLKEGVALDRQPEVRNTFVVVGAKRPLDLGAAVAAYDPRVGLHRMTRPEREELLAIPGSRVLTDDWAPVENFLAPVVRSASHEIASSVLVERAQTALHEGNTKAAERAAKRAVDFFADSPGAHAVLADVLAREGRLDEAILHYRKSLRVKPSQADLRVNLAVALGQRGRLAEAQEVLEEAIALSPGNSSAHSNLGIVLMQQGHLAEAIVACRRGVQANPRSVNAHTNLGVALYRAGDLAAAAAAFAEALRIDPGNIRARQNLARVESELAKGSPGASGS